MTSFYQGKLSLSISGESHGEYLEAVLSGLPKGEEINLDALSLQMARRAPGHDATSTPRREADSVTVVSGITDGVTDSDPITLRIANTNTRSSDYNKFEFTPRPSHIDYPAYVKYGGNVDLRGSGHFSGRLTAPLVAAGAICRQVLARRGITVGGHIFNIGECFDTAFDAVKLSSDVLEKLSSEYFATISPEAQQDMRKLICDTGKKGDSIGGCVEVAVTGMPVGIGNHMFAGVENIVSNIVFAVPAVKGISFGAGFDFPFLLGSEANDPYYYKDGQVVTATNNCGGICGGMTTGMPIIIKAALKPTPSIFMPQNTVDLKTGENTMLQIGGRHDPCIVPRALPGVEAAVAFAMTELLARDDRL